MLQIDLRRTLLERAILTHSRLTRAAATGKGIDRHLLGLRLMLKPGEQHPLFDDKLFSQSQTWKLSTSGLTPGERFMGTGFVLYLVFTIMPSLTHRVQVRNPFT